jgi:hypothetical protein
MEDVYLRDHVGDTGDPHNGAVSSSPDIIVRSTGLPSGVSPQTMFGQGTGTEDSETLSTAVEAGQDNFVYARVRNRGDLPIVDALAQVTVYWSQVATLVTPSSWHKIGQVGMDVPTGNVLTVTEQITWPSADVPAPGHYCFVATVGTPEDPVPPLDALADFTAFVAFVRQHNSVTWRNFNVVDDIEAMIVNPTPQPFMIRGAPKEDVEMGLEVLARLPKKARLTLEGPADLLERFRDLKVESDGKRARAHLRPAGRQDLGMVVFPAGMEADAQLHVELPKDAAERPGWTVAIRQYVTNDRLEVGRVTWYFGDSYKLPDARKRQ